MFELSITVGVMASFLGLAIDLAAVVVMSRSLLK